MIEYKNDKINTFLLDDFIGIWDNVFQEDYCKHLINLFDNSSFSSVNRSTSDILDKQITLSSFFLAETHHMHQGIEACLNLYMKKYCYLQEFTFHSSCVLVQKTEPKGGGYHSFHAEDLSWMGKERHLAWTVYLNDVEEGSGETEFLYQEKKVNPVMGRVCIWPSSFTHLHRGNPTKTNKYIATGWYSCSNLLTQFNFNKG